MASPFRNILQRGLGAGAPVRGTKGASSGPVFGKALQGGQAKSTITLSKSGKGTAGYGPGGDTQGGRAPRGRALNVNPSSGAPAQTGVGGRLGKN